MKKLMIQGMALLLTTFLSNIIQASATGFIGTEVVGAVYCCTDKDRISEPREFIVSSDVEYGAIEDTGDNIVGASIDIRNTVIEINYKVEIRTAGGEFNGYILDFRPNGNGKEGQLPEIKSISLNSVHSTFDSSEISLDSDSDSISISLPNLPVKIGSTIYVDVVFVPEDDCLVYYTIKGPLKIPCLSQPSENGEMILEVDMKLSPWPGCDYTLDSVTDLKEQFNVIDIFANDPQFSEGCKIAIVHYSTTGPQLDTWTVFGFNDDEVFNKVELDNQDIDLIDELILEFQDRSKVIELVTPLLSITPQYDPLAYIIKEIQVIDSASIKTESCEASTESIPSQNEIDVLQLTIPCISIPDSIGETGKYQAVFEEMPGSSQTTFVLKSSEKVE